MRRGAKSSHGHSRMPWAPPSCASHVALPVARKAEKSPATASGDEGSERGRVIVPLTAGRVALGASPCDSGTSGPGEMGQGSLPTSNGITLHWGDEVPAPRTPRQDHLGINSCASHVGLPVAHRRSQPCEAVYFFWLS